MAQIERPDFDPNQEMPRTFSARNEGIVIGPTPKMHDAWRQKMTDSLDQQFANVQLTLPEVLLIQRKPEVGQQSGDLIPDQPLRTPTQDNKPTGI